jgi:methyl-accepting chemotaxis protein
MTPKTIAGREATPSQDEARARVCLEALPIWARQIETAREQTEEAIVVLDALRAIQQSRNALNAAIEAAHAGAAGKGFAVIDGMNELAGGGSSATAGASPIGTMREHLEHMARTGTTEEQRRNRTGAPAKPAATREITLF